MGEPNHKTLEAVQAQFQAHEAEAKAVQKSNWAQPKTTIGAYVKETRGIVEFARLCWKTGPNGAPALSIGHTRFGLDRLDRLDGLLDGLQYANALELIEARPAAEIGPKVERAEEIAGEINAALSFVLDDGVHEPADDKLAAIQAQEDAMGEAGSSVGQVLLAWVLFAREEQARLVDLEDFDMALLTEGAALAADLTRAKQTPARRTELRALRLGFYTLAHIELQNLRKAARYVYRKHPDVQRRFASTILRNSRLQQRLQAKLDAVDAQEG